MPYAGKLYSSPKLDFQTVDRKVILQEMKKELEYAVQWVPDGVPKGEVSKGRLPAFAGKNRFGPGRF